MKGYYRVHYGIYSVLVYAINEQDARRKFKVRYPGLTDEDITNIELTNL